MLAFIKTWWKQIGIILLIVMCAFYCNRAKSLAQKLQDQIRVDSIDKRTLREDVTKWTDKYGKEHALTQTYEIANQQMFEQHIKDQAALANVKPSQVTGLKVYVDTLHGSVPLKVDTFWFELKRDSIVKRVPIRYLFGWNDPWIAVKGSLGESKDSLDISGTDTVSVLEYWKRPSWIFGPKTHYVDIMHTNPHITTIGARDIQLHDYDKKYSVGVGISIGYPTLIQVGVSVHRSLFKF